MHSTYNKISAHSILFNLLLLLLTRMTFAQQADMSVNEVRVMARLTSNQVLLRWAPSTPSVWVKANNFGYTIERFTITKNGILLDVPIREQLTSETLLPDPLESWREIVEQNDYAAILAQALYGEVFEVEDTQGGLAQIINEAEEIDQRFSFALFAADLNFEAAQKAALGYIDTTVVNNEEYLYRISVNVPEEILKIQPGIVSIKINSLEALPKPIDLFAVPQDKNVLLTWDYEMFKSTFTSYFIERSENGTEFKRLNEVPLVNLNDEPDSPSKRMFYMDTLSSNDKKYDYRVQGISPFGELSPYSDVVSAHGIKKLEEVPHIDRHDFDTKGDIILQWTFNKEAENQLHSFEVNWAAQEKGPYKRIKESIDPSLRKTIISEPEPSNYYSITAVSKNNHRTTSLISYVQTIDSIPPSRPVGITGVVDSLGIVKLQWAANTEKDMLGYRVFRGNLSNEEFSQISIAPVENANFTDTVQIKSLNRMVFYKIVAVDQRYNMSEYSEPYMLTKPDVIPPSAPIFSTYKVKETGIELNWINSSSDDLHSHQLYRQQTDLQEKGWLLIFKTDTVSFFTDKTVEPATQYRYAIFAEDKAGLKSLPSTPITASSKFSTTIKMIKDFKAVADRTNYKIDISWRKLPDEVSEILIYKSKNDEKPVIWKQMPNAIHKITDTSVSPGNKYIYQMKVITKQGNHSQLSHKEVNY